MTETPTFWWNNVDNFGDQLTVPILQTAGLTPRWASAERAKLTCIGSVLEMLPTDYDGIIAGAGQLFPGSTLTFPHAEIKGVRGPLTAKTVGGDPAIGDPGLLASDYAHAVGGDGVALVPHWNDRQSASTHPGMRIISVAGDPVSVIEEIARCDVIITTSLHAAIVADSLGIPRIVEVPPDYLTQGKLFKFQDYSASVGTVLRPGQMVAANALMVDKRKREIRDMLASVVTMLNG